MAVGRGNLLRALQIHDDPPTAVRIDESAARIGDADHSFPAATVRIDDPPALLGSGMAAGRGSLLRPLYTPDDPPGAISIDDLQVLYILCREFKLVWYLVPFRLS
jgi:hypothetical protein